MRTYISRLDKVVHDLISLYQTYQLFAMCMNCKHVFNIWIITLERTLLGATWFWYENSVKIYEIIYFTTYEYYMQHVHPLDPTSDFAVGVIAKPK